MLTLPSTVQIFLARDPADLRKSFDGLAELVRGALGADPLCGHLFVFRNKRGDRLKVLAWDHDGWTIFYKRLEQGVFQFPTLRSDVDAVSITVRPEELTMLLAGIDLASVRRRKRYVRPA
jgi:transposase